MRDSFCCGIRTLVEIAMIFHFHEMFVKVKEFLS